MEDKDVDSILRLTGLRTNDEESQFDFSREVTIQKLMSLTLQCLGAIRVLVVEQEKVRVARDCCDIDGTNRDDGIESRLERDIFSTTARSFLDAILTAKDIDVKDPTKDLIESFPWSNSIHQASWFKLNWSIIAHSDSNADQLHTVKSVLKLFPNSVNEIDKKGQHYLSYAIRTNLEPLVMFLLQQNRHCVKFKDGTGKLAIHYVAAHGQSLNLLYTVVEAMPRNSMEDIMTNCTDDLGNLPLHLAANGSSSLEMLNEILFANPDAAKTPNVDELLPLHLAACGTSLEKVKTLFSAYPNAVSIADKNGWLPLHHAAFTSKSVEIIQYIHERFPEAMNRPHVSGRLPHHYAAVACNSSKAMQYLLDVYPDGAKTFDLNRRLPLHNLVARCTHMTPARLRCLRLLLEVYPHGASMAGKDGRTPLDLARRDCLGDLVLRLLLRADPSQDPEALGEISFLASKGKYRES